MSRNYRKQYDRRSRSRYDMRPRGRSTRWNIPRIAAALACLIGAIILIILVPKLLDTGEETSDNAASRIAAGSDGNAATEGAVMVTLPPDTPTPEPTPKQREKAVALTFDDGPKSTEEDKGIKGTNGLLDTLKKYGAHATFFVQGYRCEINKDILKREIEEGHEIGNHSWDHPQLSELSMKDVNSQLSRTSELVKELTDGYEITLVRPPYGAISDAMRENLKYPMILWDVDTLDWKDIASYGPGEKEKEVLKTVKKEVKDGSIILMHDIHETSCEAVKLVVPWLIENGYDILTVSELMARKGIDMKNGKAYASASN
ncbi:MAG: polysaccharide deacetylase family protein [Eubacterium sp.]|nr:polysaccharide deacetylase family protein [Eubacterium sp.]